MGAAFLWGLLGASSLVLGALLVALHPIQPRTLGLVMGFGAGVLISAVSFELVEQAAEVSGDQGGVALGLFAGTLVYFFGDRYLERHEAAEGSTSGAAIGIVLGTVLDGIPESAVLGLTLLETGSIGVAMLVAVFVSNLPEAISATSDLLESGWTHRRALRLWITVALASALAAALGYGLLDGAAPRTVAFVQSFAGGAILCMLTSTMVPEAYERAGRATGLVATLGFAMAFFISLVEG
jgi:ZIP family zinc transporter